MVEMKKAHEAVLAWWEGATFTNSPLKCQMRERDTPKVLGLTDLWTEWYFYGGGGDNTVFIPVECECLKDIQVEIPSKQPDIKLIIFFHFISLPIN